MMRSNKKPEFINKRDIYENNILLINKLTNNYKYKRIINSIKFSCFFFNERKSVSPNYYIRLASRIFENLIFLKLSSNYKFILKNENIINGKKSICFTTINTTEAIHYQKLETKLINLISNEIISRGSSVSHFSLVTSNHAFSFGCFSQFKSKLQALIILFSFAWRTYFKGDKEAKNLVFNRLDKFYIHLVDYLLQYKYCLKIFQNSPPDFLVTINENWMPQSVIIDCCKKLKIPTAIYPHGIIGSTITLPSECDIFLFWNEQMKNNFGDLTFNKNRNLVIGALESLAEDINPNYETLSCEYDVLLISQLSVADNGDNIAYKDIFFVWKKFLEAYPTFKVCIKLHPFEGEKEVSFLNEVFYDFLNHVTIVNDKNIPISNLIQKSKRISTVSSSAITHGFYLKRPILLFNPPASLQKNFPVSNKWIFSNFEELKKVLANETAIYSNMNEGTYSWVQEKEVKKNIKGLVDRLTNDKSE